jgi:hypothetical protein
VNVNGYEYRNTVGVMSGRHMISISAAVRKDTGLKAGDLIHVALTLAGGPREVTVPDLRNSSGLAPEAIWGFCRSVSW